MQEQIFDKVWGFDKDVEMDNVELYVFYLRKKINFKANRLNLRTIRGIGGARYKIYDSASNGNKIKPIKKKIYYGLGIYMSK